MTTLSCTSQIRSNNTLITDERAFLRTWQKGNARGRVGRYRQQHTKHVPRHHNEHGSIGVHRGICCSSSFLADFTDGTHGNAIGVGLADVITRRLFDKIDYAATYANVVTSSFLERGKIPVVAETDRDAFAMALRSCGHVPEGRKRIVRILDTLHLEHVYVSAAILEDVSSRGDVEVLGPGPDLFDKAGRLTPF